jgi:hypothetical protein
MSESRMQQEYRNMVPDIFEIPAPRGGKLASMLTALAMTAIVVGATVALVVMNDVPSEDPQVIVGG